MAQDIEGIVFNQKGYWIIVVSSHDTKVIIEQPDASRVDLFIKVDFLYYFLFILVHSIMLGVLSFILFYSRGDHKTFV